MKALFVTLIFVCHGCAATTAPPHPGPIGTWAAHENGGVSIVVFEPDGSGGMMGDDGTVALGFPFTYEVRNGRIHITAWSDVRGPFELEAVLLNGELHMVLPEDKVVFERDVSPRHRWKADELRESVEKWKSKQAAIH